MEAIGHYRSPLNTKYQGILLQPQFQNSAINRPLEQNDLFLQFRRRLHLTSPS